MRGTALWEGGGWAISNQAFSKPPPPRKVEGGGEDGEGGLGEDRPSSIQPERGGTADEGVVEL